VFTKKQKLTRSPELVVDCPIALTELSMKLQRRKIAESAFHLKKQPQPSLQPAMRRKPASIDAVSNSW
jgi:hypothetical protein